MTPQLLWERRPCDEGIPLGIWYRRKGSRLPNASMMAPDGRKSFKIGLVVLIQYRRGDGQRATQPATQPVATQPDTLP